MHRHPYFHRFVRSVARFHLALCGGLKVTGQDRIPLTGPVIFAPNHISYLDTSAVAGGMSRMLRFMAKEELWDNKLIGGVVSGVGGFPIRRGEGDSEAIRNALAALADGDALLIYPEGTRGDGVTIGPINRGVAMLAKRSGAAVVPVAITGTNIIMPKRWPGQPKQSGRRHVVRVEYGEPFTYAEIAKSSSDRENRDKFANYLTDRLVELCARNGLPLRSAQSSLPKETSVDLESGSEKPA